MLASWHLNIVNIVIAPSSMLASWRVDIVMNMGVDAGVATVEAHTDNQNVIIIQILMSTQTTLIMSMRITPKSLMDVTVEMVMNPFWSLHSFLYKLGFSNNTTRLILLK